MEIVKETRLKNLKWAVYCVLFNTGHFYIGSTNDFKRRQEHHISAIKRKIGVYSFLDKIEATCCEIFVIQRFQISYVATDFEKDLIATNMTSPLLLNIKKGRKQILNSNQLIWQKLKDLSEDLQNQ